MTVSELYQLLDSWYPVALSCEWDHDGIMCMPKANREAKKILIALDATKDTVSCAIQDEYDVIITHHPMLFSPLYSVSETDALGDSLCQLIQNNISVFSFHTRMDAGQDGVNDALAQTLGLNDIEVVNDFIRMGSLPKPISFTQFALQAKKTLRAPCCKCSVDDPQRMVQRIAVCGGEGKDFLPDAITAGADVYLTGNLSYHTLNSIAPSPIGLIIAGHYETEQIICKRLQNRLQDALPDVQIDVHECNSVITI